MNVVIIERDSQTGKDVRRTIPYVHDVVCRCMTERQEVSSASCGLVGLEQMRLGNFLHDGLAGEDWRAINSWCAALPGCLSDPFAGLGFVLFGPTGTGKTHLAAALCHAVRASFARPHFVAEADFLGQIARSYQERSSESPHEEDIIRQMQAHAFLVIDDAGQRSIHHHTGEVSADNTWATERLFRVIDRRVLERKPFVITTNKEPTALVERWGQAIVSRLRLLRWVPFSGEDRR